jgi:hypothetical protein
MYGQVFFCSACHRFKAVQEGYLVDFLSTWGAGSRLTTDGTAVNFQFTVLCGSCMPPGAEGVPLAGIGLRPLDSRLSETTPADFLRQLPQ